MFRFTCTACGEVHEGMPAFGWPHPIYYTAVPEEERAARCVLTSDMCMIDGEDFFVRGCIEIPVHGQDESFSWGVWTTLSEKSFREYEDIVQFREAVGPRPLLRVAVLAHLGLSGHAQPEDQAPRA